MYLMMVEHSIELIMLRKEKLIVLLYIILMFLFQLLHAEQIQSNFKTVIYFAIQECHCHISNHFNFFIINLLMGNFS